MRSSDDGRPGMVAKCIFALIVIVGVATLAIGIYAMRRESPPARGSQALPAQAAEQAGQLPRPAVPAP